MPDGLVHTNLPIPIKGEEVVFSSKLTYSARGMEEQPSNPLPLCPAPRRRTSQSTVHETGSTAISTDD